MRWDEHVSAGPAVFYFEDDERPPLRGDILAVNRFRLNDLTPERLRLPDVSTVEGYIAGLQMHYPQMPNDAEVDVVTSLNADEMRATRCYRRHSVRVLLKPEQPVAPSHYRSPRHTLGNKAVTGSPKQPSRSAFRYRYASTRSGCGTSSTSGARH